jgi:hypothetical protein
MPLILRYVDNSGETVTGKAATLDDDGKLRTTINLVAEAYLGAEAAGAMSKEGKAAWVAEMIAAELRGRAKAYRNERAIQELLANADKETDL